MARQPTVVNHESDIIEDLSTAFQSGLFCDATIILDDGELEVCKGILAARSEYFATMFSNNFVEGETGKVRVPCTKFQMEIIMKYIYLGKVDLQNYSLRDLVELMNLTRMMLFKSLFVCISCYIRNTLDKYKMQDILSCLVVAEGYKLDAVQDEICHQLDRYIDEITDLEEVKSLTTSLIKKLMFGADLDPLASRKSSQFDRFKLFKNWLSSNDDNCNPEDLKLITGTFKIEEFTVSELLNDVRKSGLLDDDDICCFVEKEFYAQKNVNSRLLQIVSQLEEENQKLVARVSRQDQENAHAIANVKPKKR